MGGVVGFVAGTLIGSPCGEDVAFLESNCLTGSVAGDVALSIGVGALVGGAVYLLSRGDWNTWVEDGQLKG